MKDYAPSELRSFAVLGHASAGKTMLTEAMLACSGRIGRMGSIAAGTTTSDYHASEKQHQISVHCSLLNTEWMGKNSTSSIHLAIPTSSARASARCASATSRSS